MRKFYAGLLLVLLCLTKSKSHAQVSAYTFAQSSGSYTAITGGTVLGTATANSIAGSIDDAVFNIPNGSFPFTFTFNGVGYTGCNVNTNGYITFGATAPATNGYTPISAATAYSGAASAFGGDINSIFSLGTPALTGTVRWETVGVAPNREIVIQWEHYRPTFSTSTTNVYVFSFQVRLSETSNVVRFVYGGQLAYLVGSTSISSTKQIGLRGATNADFNTRTNTAGVLFTASTAGGANSSSQSYNTTATPPGMPSSGLIYTWTPPSCVPPTGVNSSAVTINSATIGWSPASPAPGAGYEYEVRTSGAAGSGATGLAASGTTAAGVTTANITGLTSSTNYSIYVRSVCSAGTLFSAWTAATNFTTLSCAPNFNQSPATICPNGIQTITVTGGGSSTQTFSSGAINLAIPDNNATGLTTPAIVVPASVISAAGNLKFRVNLNHTWSGDLIVRINSPCGQTFLFDRLGVPQVSTVGNSMDFSGIYEFDIAAAQVLPETAAGTVIPAGAYRPSDATGNAHNFAGISFPCSAGGNWTLTVSDNASLDVGTLFSWEIVTTSAAPATATFTPVTGLFTNPAATIPYVAGTPVSVVYASVGATANYVAVDPTCPTSPTNITVTVTPATTISVQPANAVNACAGGGTSFSVTAAGTAPVTYQWQVSTNGGGLWNNVPNIAPYSGATTATLVVNPVTTALNNYQYRVIVTGGCGAVTSNPATLTVDNITHTNIVAPSVVCSAGTINITGTATNGVLNGYAVLGSSGNINLGIPDGSAAGISNTIVLPATTFTAANDLKVRVNLAHTWIGDLIITLTSPCGTTFLLNRPGVPATTLGNNMNFSGSYTFDLSAATVIPEVSLGTGVNVPNGAYRPSDVAGNPHNWAGATFPCNGGGNWQLNISDNAAIDVGTWTSWDIIGPSTNYTHTLTGSGTITQNPPTGPNNSNASFTVTGMTAGNQVYTLTSTDPNGCSVSTQIPILVNQTPIITFVQSPANPICNGQIQTITANVVPPTINSFSQGATTHIPGGQPAITSGIGGPYPSTISVSGLPTTGVTVKSVSLGNYNHTFPDDVDILLVSPTGQRVVLMSDVGGGTDAVGINYLIDDSAPVSFADAAVNPAGTYKPTNIGATDDFPSPGPGSVTDAAPALSTFNGNPNGTWSLYIVDDTGGDVGYLGNWSINFNVPSPVVFTPNGAGSGLYSDPAATVVYTGTPTTVVYAKVASTTVYTATSTVAGCTGSNTVTVTVNQLPAITVQPTPATQTICPGFNVNYSVTATGTGLTYQWRRNGVNLVNNAQVTGVNTNALSITNVTAANSGNYDVVVSGACPPSVTSNTVVLNVATTPVISTAPANRAVCVGQTASFTVATVGSVPAPTIFQWQVSTDGGATFTNLTTGGSYTATYTTDPTVIGMNNYRYRVIVTNSCGQTITSTAAVLTVNALPVVTATALTQRICVSDTLIPLTATPVGGSWSGTGVSGFNFVPTATAVGTYNLTYTYTGANGCTNTATIVAKVEDCQERLRLLTDDAVILYPNPNNGRFNIRINSTLYNYLGMKVYNMQGQLVNGKIVNDILVSPVYTGLVYGRVIPIDLSDLPSGNYLVKFYYDDGVRTSEKGFKVVIAR